MSIHSFIHSGHLYSAPSSLLLLRGAPDYSMHGYCIGASRRSAQATAGKGLAQGPYVAARAGVEPTTLRLKVIAPNNAPHTSHMCMGVDSGGQPGHAPPIIKMGQNPFFAPQIIRREFFNFFYFKEKT